MFEFIDAAERTKAWYRERRKGVTASEIAAVLGLSNWCSPYTLFMRKTGAVQEQPDNERMELGRELEAVVLRRFAKRHTELLVAKGGLYRSAPRPWQLATPDGLAYDGPARVGYDPTNLSVPADPDHNHPVAVVQAKYAATQHEWGEDGSDEIPLHYRCQVMWEMDVMDVGVAYVPVIFGNAQYREYVVQYCVTDIDIMRRRAVQFLERLRDGEPPPIDWSPSTTDTLKKLHPELEDVDAEVPERAVNAYQVFQALEKFAEKRKRQAENEIRAALGSAARGVVDGQKVLTRSMYDRHTVKGALLKKDHPDIWERYNASSVVDRLNFLKEKHASPNGLPGRGPEGNRA
jgi:putative phage-type endonuclease